MKTDGRLLDQFASTFREWHYLASGGAVGFLVGFAAAVYLVIRLSRAERRRRTARRGREPRRWGGEDRDL